MSTQSYDDSFRETDPTTDRTLGEKVRDAAKEAGGKIKEGWGDLTDNERLQAEGRDDVREADASQAADRGNEGVADVYHPFQNPDEPLV